MSVLYVAGDQGKSLMVDDRGIQGVVYLGSEWLMYAHPDLQFNLSESVAPALIFGPPEKSIKLTLDNGQNISASLFLHAGGAWSCMYERSAMVFLYADPLSAIGISLQRCVKSGVRPWATSNLPFGHGVALTDLCLGSLAKERVTQWVNAVFTDAREQTGGTATLGSRLTRLRQHLHQRGEGRVDPTALAVELGLSAEHARKLFRQDVGTTLSSYQSWVRLYQVAVGACEAQQRGQTPKATDLVNAAGFYDASHATRATRRYFDISPTEMLAPKAFVDCR